MILEPNNPSSLDFSLNNPSDLSTYYIQAVVRAVVANTVIGTYNLSLVTGQYYRAPWTTPVDASGVGFEIVILFSVYTDAGHTQLSPAYGTTMVKYIVRHLASQNLGGFTRGGGDVDYKKLESMMQKAISGIKFPEEDHSDMQEGFSAIMKILGAMPEKFSEELKKAVQVMQTLSEQRHGELKDHVTHAVTDSGKEIAENVYQHEQNSDARHTEALGAHKAVSDKVDDMNEKIPEPQEDVPGILPPTQAVAAVGKKVDDLKNLIAEHHAKSIKEIRKPVNFNFGARGGEPAEEGEDENGKVGKKASDLVAASAAQGE